MNKPSVTEIIELEERLRVAMLNSDVKTLDELLAPELTFTNHIGQVLRKQDDISAHRSGIIKISKLILSEPEIQFFGDIAIVSVRVHLSGNYGNISSSDDFRFTRVWAVSSNGIWQVIAAHSSLVK